MICYKGTTFCSGGTPLCAEFGRCSRALTDEVRERAQAARLSISQYIAPTAMPCYRLPNQPPVKDPRRSRPQSHISSMSDAEWRKEFELQPQRPDTVIAEQLRCSSTSVRTARIRLGYPTARNFGVSRPVLYTEKDALLLIAACKKTDGNLAAAGRRCGMTKSIAKHIRSRFRDIFEQHGF